MKYFFEHKQKIQLLSVVLFFALVLGIVTGSIFYVKLGADKAMVNTKTGEAFLRLTKTENGFMIAKNYFIEQFMCCILIFIAAYFRAGIVLSGGVIIRKGFVTGFTAAAAAGAYGMGGAALMASTVFDLIISSAVLILFSAVSSSYSMSSEKKSKKFLIFFLIFSISIFGMISFSRGFMTTTFMKIIYPKIT